MPPATTDPMGEKCDKRQGSRHSLQFLSTKDPDYRTWSGEHTCRVHWWFLLPSVLFIRYSKHTHTHPRPLLRKRQGQRGAESTKKVALRSRYRSECDRNVRKWSVCKWEWNFIWTMPQVQVNGLSGPSCTWGMVHIKRTTLWFMSLFMLHPIILFGIKYM